MPEGYICSQKSLGTAKVAVSQSPSLHKVPVLGLLRTATQPSDFKAPSTRTRDKHTTQEAEKYTTFTFLCSLITSLGCFHHRVSTLFWQFSLNVDSTLNVV